MNSRSDKNSVETISEGQRIYSAFEEYVQYCLNSTNTDEVPCESKVSKTKAQSKQKFPNLAGFCRYMRMSLDDFEKIEDYHPLVFNQILTALEDEALNSSLSPSLLSTYLKKRLKYDTSAPSTNQGEQLQICFEHDIFEDGE